MNLNLDSTLSELEKEIVIKSILIPLINKIQLGNKKIKKILKNKLELDEDKINHIYNQYKINIKKLEIKINKNNLIKII